MSALLQASIFAETSPVVTVLGNEQINPPTPPTAVSIDQNSSTPSPPAAVATSQIAKSASPIAFHNEQRLACRDLMISACFGSTTAVLATILGLLSVASACSFAFGSLVAYAIAAHRILALSQSRKP